MWRLSTDIMLVARFDGTIVAVNPAWGTLLGWAEKHAAIILRFGRFPHRNAILGRASTPEEIAFLGEPGSRF